MPFVALMCPAALSVAVYRKRRGYEISIIDSLIAYLIFVLLVNLCAMSTVVYLFRINDPMQDYLKAFGFFIKYILIASAYSLILPPLYDLIKRYFSIKFDDKTSPVRKRKDAEK